MGVRQWGAGRRADDLRREGYTPVVAVAGFVVQGNMDSHRRSFLKAAAGTVRLLLLRGGLDQRLEVEKGGADGFVHLVEAGLQPVHIFVHAVGDHFIDIRIGQIRSEPSQAFFGGVLGRPGR